MSGSTRRTTDSGSMARVVTGTPGPPIAVVSAPIGRPATVLMADGAIVRGFVPPPGYPLGTNDTLHYGPECRARIVNPNGDVFFDADGRQQAKNLDQGARIELRFLVRR